MSAPTPDGGLHRARAKGCLDDTAAALGEMPVGTIKTDVMLAHSAKAQVFASAAIAHALLEIGDVLRAAIRESTDG